MGGRCGCQGVCSCATGNTPSVAWVGTGTAGDPYKARAVPAADGWNMVHVDGTGVWARPPILLGPDGNPINPLPGDPLQIPAACILDYAGNPIPPDGSGCIQLPLAGIPPAYGCGLTALGDGTLVADADGVWPGSDLQANPFSGDNSGTSDIFCVDGMGLRGVPEHTSVLAELTDFVLVSTLEVIPVAGTYASPSSPTFVQINPSGARKMNMVFGLTLLADITNPPTSGTVVRLQANVNGAGWVNVRARHMPESLDPAGETIRYEAELHATLLEIVNAGDAVSVQLRMQASNTGSGAPGTVERASVEISLSGVTV